MFDFTGPKVFRNAFNDVYSLDEFEKLVNLRPFCSSRRVSSTNENFTTSWDSQGWVTDGTSIPASNMQQILDAGVVQINDCSRVNKTVNSICADLETQTGHCTDAHIYYAHDETKDSFVPHWDKVNNFIVMVHGEALWKVDKQISTEGERNDPSRCKDNIIEEILYPGDAIYIPTGYYHCASSRGQRLSITFAMACQSEFADLTPQDRNWIAL